jgi:glycosyltransferase involved in cell wall biosynthesis
MKILYVVPDGDTLGGIITSSEQFMQGFRECGHEATFCLLNRTKNNGDNGGSDHSRWQDPGPWIWSPHTNMWVHPVHGWRGKYLSMVGRGIDDFITLAKQHDVVVWSCLFGLRNNLTEGTTDWTRMFTSTERPCVVMIQDDHLVERYPWIIPMAPYITGWVGVQRVSYDVCAGLGRRAIIYSGQDVSPVEFSGNREKTLFSCQTWKRWKRVDRLVAAAPYLRRHGIRTALSGVGIEAHYMWSKEKCRDVYYVTRENDPDAADEHVGQKIWDVAMASGMEYLGSITEDQRDQCLLKSQFLLDLSTRPESTGQINRTVVEAIRHGAIPVCVPKFISGNDEGVGELFTHNENYLGVRSDWHPKQLADYLDLLFRLPESEFVRIRENGLRLIGKFDRKIAARQLVELALGQRTGWDYAVDPIDGKLVARGEAMFRKIFGELPERVSQPIAA